jgi:hypothetical protein
VFDATTGADSRTVAASPAWIFGDEIPRSNRAKSGCWQDEDVTTPPSPLPARRVNRTVLARQLLLERIDLDVPTALQRVGGLQNQYAPSGYVGLWTRLRDFDRDSLTSALEDRSVVQGTLMRSTIHLVAASDYWTICAGIRNSRREWWQRIERERKLGDIDHDELAAVLRKELARGPRAAPELVTAFERAGYDKRLWEGAGLWVDMVRVPPSGTWERRRADLFARADLWVRPVRRPAERVGLRFLIERYLGAFGPAPLAAVATWAGVPKSRLEPLVAAMPLTAYGDDRGVTLLDLADGQLVAEDAPAPVRFLPTWESVLLVHCRHSGVLPEHLRSAIFHTKNPQSVGTVLVDGMVAAKWSWVTDHVVVDELCTLTKSQRREVADEAGALTDFYRG